jgi:hypothetical protein
MAPGNDVTPPITTIVRISRLICGSNDSDSTVCWWYANSAPATAAQKPEMANAVSRARATLTP